jgi:hypothetical protein
VFSDAGDKKLKEKTASGRAMDTIPGRRRLVQPTRIRAETCPPADSVAAINWNGPDRAVQRIRCGEINNHPEQKSPPRSFAASAVLRQPQHFRSGQTLVTETNRKPPRIRK